MKFEPLSTFSKVLVLVDHCKHNKLYNNVRFEFPEVEFVVKKEKDWGQAKSLNLILSHIGDYEFWVHWEDSWIVKRPFLVDAMRVMSDQRVIDVNLCGIHSHATQSDNPWYGKEQVIQGIRVKVRQARNFQEVAKECEKGQVSLELWPAFSLSPGIFRVSAWVDTGHYFSEEKKDWPLTFEYKWACELWAAHATNMQVQMLDIYTYRHPLYVSTYHGAKRKSRKSLYIALFLMVVVVVAILYVLLK